MKKTLYKRVKDFTEEMRAKRKERRVRHLMKGDVMVISALEFLIYVIILCVVVLLWVNT